MKINLALLAAAWLSIAGCGDGSSGSGTGGTSGAAGRQSAVIFAISPKRFSTRLGL
jgi:hypothetical protein